MILFITLVNLYRKGATLRAQAFLVSFSMVLSQKFNRLPVLGSAITISILENAGLLILIYFFSSHQTPFP